MPTWSRCVAVLVTCAVLAACGAKHGPSDAVVATKPGRVKAPLAAAPERAAPAAQNLPRPEAVAEVESVSDASFSISPIARAVAAAAPSVPSMIPAKWVENQHYATLVPAQPTGSSPDKVEVVEVFWYGCPHCFHLDPFLEGWRTSGKAAFVEFNRMPVIWAGNDVNRSHARLYYTLEALGKLPTLHAEVFREIHQNGNLLVDARDPAHTEQMQKAFLLAHGVSAADFDRTYRSFSVESKLQRAEQYTQRYKVLGVPLMVVGGKYSADLGTAGGDTELLSLVNDLASAEHRR